MKHNLTKETIINIGKRLAEKGYVIRYAPGSHSHNVFTLFPQTAAQYEWLRKNYGTTCNNIVYKNIEQVLSVCPELKEYVKKTKSGDMCRIYLTL